MSKITVIREETEEEFQEYFERDILTGLSSSPKSISSKYFYDDKGSQLFSEIMKTSEYYPTDSELEILAQKSPDIVSKLPNEKFNLIELGAGDGEKTKILIEELRKQKKDFTYIPLDISRFAVKEITEKFSEQFEGIDQHGLVGEYLPCLDYIKKNIQGRNVILFLGSTIGNFNKTEAIVFLRLLWKQCEDGDLLMSGFDLKKDIDTLLHAYNDSAGVTKQFNINLLSRINNELGAEFDIAKFQHFGTYNPIRGAMESHLISLEKQEVYVKALEKSFHFDAFEAIHVEYSYKYLPSDCEYLAKETGYEIMANYYDSKKYYLDSLWKVKKS